MSKKKNNKGTEPPATIITNKQFLYALIGLVVAATVLRIIGLGSNSFWNDEISTIVMADGTLGEMFRAVRNDVHPPLHFFLIWIWQHIVGTDSEAWHRLPSFVFGVATVWQIGLFGKRLYDPQTGIVAALLSTTSLYAIHYSQESRGYALLLLLTVVFANRYITARRKPTIPTYAVLALIATIGLYSHYFFAFVMATFCLHEAVCFVATKPNKPGNALKERNLLMKYMVASMATASILFIPWLVVLISQSKEVSRNFWTWQPDLWLVGMTLRLFASLAHAPWGIVELNAVYAAFAAAGLTVLLGAIVVVLQQKGALNLKPAKPSKVWVALPWVWLAVCVGLPWLISQSDLHIYTHRNVIVALPALWLLMARLVAVIPQPLVASTLLATMLAPAIGELPTFYQVPRSEEWRELAYDLSRGVGPDHAIAIDETYQRKNFEFYAEKFGISDEIPRIDVSKPLTFRPKRVWLVRVPTSAKNARERTINIIKDFNRIGYQPKGDKGYRDMHLIMIDQVEQPPETAPLDEAQPLQ